MTEIRWRTRAGRRPCTTSVAYTVLALALSLLFPTFAPAQDASSNTDAPKAQRVLLLMDQSPLLPRNLKIQEGLSETRKNLAVPVSFFSEVTDLTAIDSAEFQKFDLYLRNKYGDQPFDFVVSFWIPEAAYAQQYWPNTPLINLSSLPTKVGDQQIDLALNLVSRIHKTVDFATHLNPKPSHCTVIQGDLPEGSPGYQAFEQRLSQHCNSVDFLTSHDTQRLADQLSRLDANGWVFFFPYTFSHEGVSLIPRKYIRDLSAASAAPIFGMHGQMLGQGIVGGDLIDPQLLGQATIQAMIEHLNTGAFQTAFKSSYLGVDQTQLELFFPGATLPADAVVTNPLPPLLSAVQIKILLLIASALVVALLVAGIVALRQTRKLSVSEEKYRSIFEASKVGIAMCRMDDGSVVECNQAFLDIIDYTLDEALALTYWDITPRTFEQEEARQLQSLKEKGRYGPYEKLYIRKDGAEVPVLLNGTVLRGADGQEYIWSIVQDISQRKEIEDQLRQAKDGAEKANTAKSAFLSSMSHELRTPLNSIIGFGQLLKLNPKEPLTEKQSMSVDEILRGGNHLLSLIDDVLHLARIEAGKLELTIENVELNTIADEALPMIQGLAERRGISVSIPAVSASPLMVRADATRLKQVLLNLLSNAIKYNREGGAVAVGFANTGEGMVRVTVSDTGRGIPQNRQGELFSAFNRLGAETSNIEGTGIGLLICKEMTELMGGTIGFVSEEGKGSTFWFEVPVGQSDHATPAKEEPVAATVHDELPHSDETITVLYIEDSPSNIALMEMITSDIDGLNLISATTAESGIEIAREQHPGLILMDIHLPGMSGLEALRQLKSTEETKDIPVVAMTAVATKGDIQHGLREGFARYLTKPVQIPELIDTLKSILKLNAR